MSHLNIKAFALSTPDVGYRNQIIGVMQAVAEYCGNNLDLESCFVLPKDVTSYTEVKESIYYSKFADYHSFKTKIFELLDLYFAKNKIIPQIFITAFNLTENENAGKNADKLCCAIKEYYAQNKLGKIMTCVITSRVYMYQYIDFIQIPKHIMTFASRIRLLKNPKLRQKSLITVGTLNHFSKKLIKNKYAELTAKLAELKKNSDFFDLMRKFDTYISKPQKVVFCLGGRVHGNEIIFDINYAQKLLADANRLIKKNYGVIFVNGPRTPNDVTNFLYENTCDNPDIIFQNSKKIATSDAERTPLSWRIYSGKYEAEFEKLEKIGNIYPAILGFDNTIVAHSFDSYASCETINAAIPTAISKRGLYISAERYDCYNLHELLCPKYAIDWDDFVELTYHQNIVPNELKPQILSNPLHVFAETLLNRFNKFA